MLIFGKANLEREDEIAESADGEGNHAEEHHDRAVHGAELVVELWEHRATRHARFAEQPADQRQRGARIRELPAHQHHQRKAEEEEKQAGDAVLDADDLVVGREDVVAPEAQLFVMGFVRVRRPGCGDSCRLTHGADILRIARYLPAGKANLKAWVFVSLAATVTEAVCVPSLSCQAVIS
jgi:hypothetical protein